jgi:hypothetical protein
LFNLVILLITIIVAVIVATVAVIVTVTVTVIVAATRNLPNVDAIINLINSADAFRFLLMIFTVGFSPRIILHILHFFAIFFATVAIVATIVI